MSDGGGANKRGATGKKFPSCKWSIHSARDLRLKDVEERVGPPNRTGGKEEFTRNVTLNFKGYPKKSPSRWEKSVSTN